MVKHDPNKKQHILAAGIEVMVAHGYNGTSVKDIVDAAGVPKGSFYNYFESKDAFAVEALETVASEQLAASEAMLLSGEDPALIRLQNFFAAGAEYACENGFKGGCFFGNMCQEMSDNSETIRQKVRQILKQHTQMLAKVIDEIQSANAGSSMHPQVLAEFLLNAWEGTLMRMKASKSREPLDAFLAVLPALLGA